jgi:hypothetical protein
MFGKPGQGIHSYRIFNIAIVDVILTLILVYIIYSINVHYGVHDGNIYAFIVDFLGVFLTGITAHWLFCVNTTINKKIYGVI